MPRTKEPRREGGPEGAALVFFCPEHACNGHLDRLGQFIPHACPEGFEWDRKGGVRPLKPPAKPATKETSNG